MHIEYVDSWTRPTLLFVNEVLALGCTWIVVVFHCRLHWRSEWAGFPFHWRCLAQRYLVVVGVAVACVWFVSCVFFWVVLNWTTHVHILYENGIFHRMDWCNTCLFVLWFCRPFWFFSLLSNLEEDQCLSCCCTCSWYSCGVCGWWWWWRRTRWQCGYWYCCCCCSVVVLCLGRSCLVWWWWWWRRALESHVPWRSIVGRFDLKPTMDDFGWNCSDGQCV